MTACKEYNFACLMIFLFLFECVCRVGSILISVFHGSDFFSSNGLPTIIAKEPDSDMGQRKYMTEKDTQRVRRLYKCGVCLFVCPPFTCFEVLCCVHVRE